MTNQRYSPVFRDEAVRQVLDRGHSAREVSERLGGIGPQFVQMTEGCEACARKTER